MYHVLGKAEMRISKEEKKNESSSSLSTSAHTVKHLKMKFPLGKRAEIRFWLG